MANAQLLIERGYARATTNDAGKLAVDGELLNRLAVVFQSIYGLAARQRPNEFGSLATLTLAGAPPSLALTAAAPALTDVIDIRLITVASGNAVGGGALVVGAKVHLVSETESYRTFQISPTVFQRGLSIISRNQAGDPAAGAVLNLTVLDSPTPIVSLATIIDARFPVRHHELLVNDLALYLDAKDTGRNADQFARLQADQRMKLMAFATEYNLAASAVEMVFPNDRVPAVAQQ